MNDFYLAIKTDVYESIRSKWFIAYSLIFGGIIVLLLVFGLTESRIMGFSGLSRLLVTYIQLSMAILPIFILITTVRSVAGDREAGIFEYLLSLPIALSGWFWGKMVGRFMVVFLPVIIAILFAFVWGSFKGAEIPWMLFFAYSGLLLALIWCFLGMGMLISTLSRSIDVAQGSAFFLWLLFLLLLDLMLLGFIIKQQVEPSVVITIALLNPLQVFRTAAMLLFDPQLSVLGSTAFYILDIFGRTAYLIWAFVYPILLGTIMAFTGFTVFKKGDLI